MRTLILLSILLMPLTDVFAYSFIRGRHGESAHWTGWQRKVPMYYITNNNSGISSAEVKRIFEESANEWNSSSSASIILKENLDDTVQAGRNELFFSSNPTYFGGGSGVVGVTQVIFKEGSGQIIEADIILNENASSNFNTDPTKRFYLGNVVTHEMGHALGLGHSERQFSTMFYKLTEHQHTTTTDDDAALFTKYPDGSAKGAISGKIVGGDNLNGVFGTHVQAISHSTGKVVASSFSEDDGTFSIGGLPLEDTYYIYTAPPKHKYALSSYYHSARMDFCGGADYKGSFFESCMTDDVGMPTPINLTSADSSRVIGNVTIRCNQNAPLNYIENSGKVFTFSDNENVNTSFVGFFDFTEISNSTPHNITIDLPPNLPAEARTFDFHILSQSLYTKLKVRAEVHDVDGLVASISGPADNPNSDPSLEIHGTVDLSGVNGRTLTIKIIPEKLLTTYTELNQYLPDAGSFADDQTIYFMSFGLKTVDQKPILGENAYLEDNTTCPGASGTYTVSANSSTYVPKKLITKKEMPGMACGTVDMNNGSGPGGPMSFAVGLGLVFLFSSKRLLGKIEA